jgi:multidrug resistance efflux pump
MENNNQEKENIFKKPWMHSIISVVVIFGVLAGFIFWQSEKNTVSIDDSDLEAPIINLTPSSPGILNALYVKEGDHITANEEVALVGSQIISTRNDGIVASAPLVLGAYFSPGQTVVSVVDNQEMRVVGQIEETKGLSSLSVGQRATFSVDAFPGKTYEGVVDEISPVSNDNGVIFSISDERPVKNFNVKIRFNVGSYPELKSGMSAKIKIYTK